MPNFEERNDLLYTTLENLETEFESKIFFRVSRKFYVNINHIRDIFYRPKYALKLN